MPVESKLKSALAELSKSFFGKSKLYYKSLHEFVCKEGTELQSNELTKVELQIVKNALKKSNNTQAGLCFYNAQCLVMGDLTDMIEYWEGYTMDKGGFPILHGFNVINGKVIDFTHTINNKHILGNFGTEKEYLGVKFDKSLPLERLLSGKNSTSFIDNLDDGYPVLKSKWNG